MVATALSRLPDHSFQPVFQASAALREAQAEMKNTAQRLFDSLHGMQLQIEQSQCRLMDEQATIQLQREQLATGLPAVDVQAQQDLLALQQQHVDMQQQHAAIQVEMQTLREQAAEMQQIIDRQQQQINSERAEWSGELSQMRRILDKQSSWLAERTETDQTQTALDDVRQELGAEEAAGSAVDQIDQGEICDSSGAAFTPLQ